MVATLKTIILLGILFKLGTTEQDCTKSVCVLNDTSIRFFVLGDFGGQNSPPYTSKEQLAVAARISEIGTKIKSHFQLELGDNFYDYGVKNVRDSRFNETFRYVYNGSPAMFEPWYVIAGNHDHRANVEAEIEYSKNESRWVFPSLYYTVQYQLVNGPLVELIMLDTVILCGDFGMDDDPSYTPPDPIASQSQWSWLEDKLKESKADYLIVTGHYPVWSIAEHGPTECLTDRLEPMLHKYKVNVYMDGHDHNLQHLAYEKDNWQVNYIVSGACAKISDSDNHKHKVPKGSLKFHHPASHHEEKELGGFVYGQISATSATFSYYTGLGTFKHQFNVTPRK